jgi:glycosyltransferase involved in cell wall biosynthesis
MNILVPVHHFTDDPKSGIDTGLWNFSKHLAGAGHKIFVVATAVDLINETSASLRRKNIYLYKICNYESHGLGQTEALMIFFFSLLLRLFYKFDWIFIIDEARTPFSHFKLGAKLGSRILAPESSLARGIFNSGDWVYDRQRKDTGQGWDQRPVPLFYKTWRWFAFMIWYKLFPVKDKGQNSDILFCEGKESLDYYRMTNRNNPVYLPLGVENYRFDAWLGTRIDVKHKFVYLFVGRILRMKGIYHLIEAFKKLADKYSDIELWVIGGSYGEYREKLFSDIRGYENRITILGEKSREEVVLYMKSCQVVVDPMIWANFSSVALEALYCGKPLIAPLYGNTKDFVKDGYSGFLVDSRNVILLQDKMDFFYNHYDQAEIMGKFGQDFIKKYLSWEKVSKIVENNFVFFGDKEKIRKLNETYENYKY